MIKPESDKIRNIPKSAKAVYLMDNKGVSFIKAEKCPICFAIVEDVDLEAHTQIVHGVEVGRGPEVAATP